MKTLSKKTITIIIILLLLLISSVYFVSAINNPLKGNEDIVVRVEDGDNFYSIINKLEEDKKLKSVSMIKLYVKVLDKSVDVKPGEYLLSKDSSVKDIINALNTDSSLNKVKFTVPEGYSIEDIAIKLEDEGICSKSDFILAVKEYPLPSYVKPNEEKRYNLEGYLFPDTYIIEIGETPKEIIYKMIKRFEEMLDEASKATNVTVKDKDIETVVTIASMIEKEARLDNERPTIASVIVNRLNVDMKLQIDATVIYALGEHVNIVTYDDLEIDSPYNTYKNYGLPVGPISNPGIESIKATLKPESTDYLFYVLKDDNSHYFTNDDEDFLRKQEELGY
ncbi:endolytic transglycosylase MltG [Clostridium sartagoforme]|uniref:Endolytic murein transglycosylase n=1 Tax=Clostridium sartagoforme TaxID=84031 RepID=A0A4S2DP34_9CLOT|nr:endolytic transglycosylase MltG [Clostridium sartagoforme]TGY43895.1 endolytic transglycosylase MltG [Clostridium sartagoforme]